MAPTKAPTSPARSSGNIPIRAARWTAGPATSSAPTARPTPATLLTTITHAIRARFTYVAREEMGVQDPIRTLRLGSGSCRDFAVLMIEAVRALGFAARFVSGYLYVPQRSTPISPGQSRVGGGATHAWLRVYVPGAGWVEMDPTNGIVGNRDLIRVAVARDHRQAVPLHGTWTGFPSDSLGMTVEVSVTEAEPDAPSRLERIPPAPCHACARPFARPHFLRTPPHAHPRRLPDHL